MCIIKVVNHLAGPILVTRRSAHLLEAEIASAVGGEGMITLDLSGIEGITPSFLDEILTIIDEQFGPSVGQRSVRVTNPPTGLTRKFEAVGRGHALVLELAEDGSWLIKPRPSTAA